MPKTNSFTVPSLADADADYGTMAGRITELTATLSDLVRQQRTIEAELDGDTGRRLRPGVAALLGEADDGTNAMRTALAETKQKIADLEAAISIIQRRLADRKTKASTAVCAKVKPEYSRRVAQLCKAIEAVDVAHAHYDELRFSLEAEDVEWTQLIPMTPAFLGDRNNHERHLERFLREAREAGYHG